MKNIILIITICSFFSCKAQNVYNVDEVKTTYLKPPYYIKDINNYHDAIVGVWRWENGNDSFEITLQEFKMYSYPEGSGNFIDSVYGKYKYVLNGEIISEITEILPTPNFSVSLIYDSSSIYKAIIVDEISERNMHGKFELTSPTSATLYLWESEGVKVNYGNEQEWSLPTSVILTKVN